MDSLDAYEAWEEVVDERILRAVREMGFDSFTPIQEQAIPCLLRGEDIIGQAQTGTGKTAAFGIPLLQKVILSCESCSAWFCARPESWPSRRRRSCAG